MTPALYTLTGLLVAACVFLGTAKVLAVPAMRERAAHVGFSADQYRFLGALELAAAVGLVVGLGAPALGALAACGLLLLLGGALASHVKAGDGAPELAPAVVVSALAVGYLLTVVIAG